MDRGVSDVRRIDFEIFANFCRELLIRHLLIQHQAEIGARVFRPAKELYGNAIEEIVVILSRIGVRYRR